jgi:hypothetical protein
MATGWNVRLEYLTWDTNYGGTVTDITEPALIELGEHVAEFDNDGLPYGLSAPQKLSLRLNYTLLPSAMRGYLKYGYDTTLPPEPYLKRNTWWLWTDRGTNGITWYLEFVGCEEQSEGVDLEPGPGDTYEYAVELVDAMYHSMKYATGEELFSNIVTSGSDLYPRAFEAFFNILIVQGRGYNVYQKAVTENTFMVQTDKMMQLFAQGLSKFYDAKYVRSGASWPMGSFVSGLDNLFTSALTLKKQTVQTLPRTAGANLTAAEMYLIYQTTFTQLGAGITGGISATIDKYAWGRADVTPWDVLHDLAETLGVKISYQFEFVPLLNAANVNFIVRRVGSTVTHGDASATTYDAQLGASKMSERAKIIKRGSGIAKSEVQFESESDADARTVVRLSSAARGSRSMNVEPIVHNMPTYQANSDERLGRYGPLLQTNNIYFQRTEAGAAGTFVLCHENTRYRYLPGSSGAYVDATTTAGETPVQHKDDDENVGEYRLQLNAIQTTATMQTALAKFAVHVFGADQNGIVETSWNLLTTTQAMPHRLGSVHDLSYAQNGGTGGASYLASAFDEMSWSRCILTKSAVNYTTGENTVTYYVLSQSGNLL